VWYLIDVPSVVCNQGHAGFTIEIPQQNATVVKQQVPYVATFYRATNNAVSITFSITDSSIPPKNVAAVQTVELNALQAGATGLPGGSYTPGVMTTSMPSVPAGTATDSIPADGGGDGGSFRRLTAYDDADGENCEQFFLMAGMSPVEIPDTWGDARKAFLDICDRDGYSEKGCLDAEQKLFAAYPVDQTSSELFDFVPRSLCHRLLRYAIASMSLDLTSGSSVDNVELEPLENLTLNPMYFTPRRMKGFGYSSGPSFGYSSSSLSRTYPRGHYSTPYGYSGYHAIPRSTPVMVAYPMLLYHHGYYNQYGYNGNCGTLAQDGNCMKNSALPTEFNRDDLMTTGFLASDFTYPLKLSVQQVVGSDYNAAGICPTGQNNWKAPQIQSLFFALSQVDEYSSGGGFSWLSTFLQIICCLFCCCACAGAKGNQANQYMPVSSEAESAMVANGYATAGNQVQTQFTIAEGGDDGWYTATVLTAYSDNSVMLKFDDDGTEQRVEGQYVYLVNQANQGPLVNQANRANQVVAPLENRANQATS
jgi:hypothetical protein